MELIAIQVLSGQQHYVKFSIEFQFANQITKLDYCSDTRKYSRVKDRDNLIPPCCVKKENSIC